MTTHTTTSLTAFLLARIEEDQTAADANIKAAARQWDDSPLYGAEARELAECEAKRRVVELHTPNHRPQVMVYGTIIACETCGSVDDSPVEWPCDTLRALALPYVPHPDYREEWKP